ncbi:MAG: hypothetical protein IKC84_03690 [Helicobacteraceae bacterium]|nr:hypothetical protein [Helicobacteraceae bacterium]
MGYEYGDAQNIAVRCFLNQFSKNFEYFNESHKNQTLEYFDCKCPYTDVELTSANMVKDHVIPFNKKSCGLHVFGNVLIVDKKANSDKSSKSLEEYLKNYPERLQKIKEFIKVTGYLEIHEKYQQYLRETCNKLYDEIGDTIKKRCDYFQIKHLRSNPNMVTSTPKTKQIFVSKKVAISQNPQNRIIDALDKSEISDICCKNNFIINGDFTKAKRNKTGKYWANPNKKLLLNDWKIVLEDNLNKILYCFEVPQNAIMKDNVKHRKDKTDLIDIQIYCDDNTFTDSRSGISFAKWLVKTINY